MAMKNFKNLKPISKEEEEWLREWAARPNKSSARDDVKALLCLLDIERAKVLKCKAIMNALSKVME